MMPGPMELVIVLVVALIIFGPKRLPELGKSLGGGMRSFKDSVAGRDEERERELESPPRVG
jgi:sec-independent protein translocase protein TatA